MPHFGWARTHKIGVSDIIIFMHSIQSSMCRTDTHIVFKTKDHNTFYVEPETQIMVGGHFEHLHEYTMTHSVLYLDNFCNLHHYMCFILFHCT